MEKLEQFFAELSDEERKEFVDLIANEVLAEFKRQRELMKLLEPVEAYLVESIQMALGGRR